MCLITFFIQTAKYHDPSNLTTDKNTLYSVDLNLNNEAIWKQEHVWYQSEDQSIGRYIITNCLKSHRLWTPVVDPRHTVILEYFNIKE